MKALMELKCQRFGDNKSEKIEARKSKCQRLDEHNDNEKNGLDDKERNSLDKDKSDIDNGRYILIPFVSLSLFLQKVSNRPSDLGKVIKSLKHIVCIPQVCYSRSG